MKTLDLTKEEWSLLFKIIMSEKPQKGSKALLKKIGKGIEEIKKELKNEPSIRPS